jgi:hypothetical protein
MSDFIEQAKDLEQGQDAVPVDYLVQTYNDPDPALAYDSRFDPEADSDVTVPLNERLEHKRFRLREAKKDHFKKFFNDSKITDKSYESFQKSKYGHEKINLQDYKWHLDHPDVIDLDPGLANDIKAEQGLLKEKDSGGYRRSAGSGGGRSAKVDEWESAYGAPPEGHELSDRSKKFAEKYHNANPRGVEGGADVVFRNVYNIVKNICLRKSLVRHAVIYGDPGIGKCLGKDTLVTVQVPDNVNIF